ncbi:MAG TPA: hypothetical protein V6C65_16665 [Allocoleopsis sp.]
MSSSNSKFLFKALLTITGIAGTGALMGLPALAHTHSQLDMAQQQSSKHSLLLAQSGNSDSSGPSSTGNGGNNSGDSSGTSGDSGTSAGSSSGGGLGGSGNGVGSSGDAYEHLNGQPDVGPGGAEPLLEEQNNNSNMNGDSNSTDSNSMEDDTSGSGAGGGQGGAFGSPINPANPDAEGGEAFEDAPGTQPLPDAQDSSGDMNGDTNNGTMMNQDYNQSGSSSDSGMGGGQGGVTGNPQGGPNYNNRVNPANPDPVGGQGLENAPNNNRLPADSQQSPSGGSYNSTPDSNGGSSTGSGSYYNSTPGSTGGSGAGTGAGGSNSGNTGGVRALW